MNLPFKELKIAVCFSGLLRSFRDTYKIIYRNLLSPLNNPDVFVSSWSDDPSLEDLIYFNQIANNLTIREIDPVDVPEVVLNCKKIQVNIQNFYKNIYCVKNSFQLLEEKSKESNKTYDLVFYCRPDVVYRENIGKFDWRQSRQLITKQSGFSENVSIDRLFVSIADPKFVHEEVKKANPYSECTIDDMIYWGSFEYMKIVCSRIEMLEEFITRGHAVHPESYLSYCVLSKIPETKICKINFHREIIR